MKTYYTSERNTLILLALMKAHGIKKVIISPGTTNLCFVVSVQNDSYFELYSAADERSAAYMACGMSAESNEPVALSCTCATASRNYVPGLTEAFYRKLPILVLTPTPPVGRVGQLLPQVIDRSTQMNDICVYDALIPAIHTNEDVWTANIKINEAMLALKRKGGGPAHLNIVTENSDDYSIKELPKVRKIEHISYEDEFPQIGYQNIGIVVGNHFRWTEKLTNLIDRFCEVYNGVVICDQTSNYKGKYGVLASLITSQDNYYAECRNIELLVHIGEVSGAYLRLNPKNVWRVNPDGVIRDTYRCLCYVFEMSEEHFFKNYINNDVNKNLEMSFYNQWKQEYDKLYQMIPDLPFSNIWAAYETSKSIPSSCNLHFAILNSLRAWNFFKIPEDVYCYSNTGGFGIDGCLSTVLGASLASPEKLFFCFIGDLAFFYDMNSLGNRHFGNNLRIMLVNNGKGTEFRHYNHRAALLGDEADSFIAASGHYGRKSSNLVKHYAEDLGFKYMTASSKDEFMNQIDLFTSSEVRDSSCLFEIFTESKDESDALKLMRTLTGVSSDIRKNVTATMKNAIKETLGKERVDGLKLLIKGKQSGIGGGNLTLYYSSYALCLKEA